MAVQQCVCVLHTTYTQWGAHWHEVGAFIWQQQSLLSTEQCSFHAWTVRSWIKVAGAHGTHRNTHTLSSHTTLSHLALSTHLCRWAGFVDNSPRGCIVQLHTTHVPNSPDLFDMLLTNCWKPKRGKMRVKLRTKCAGKRRNLTIFHTLKLY